MSFDVERAKRRLMAMAAIDVAAVIVAAASAVGAFVYGVDWLTAVFAGALLAGFGAQIWFIASLRRANKGV